MHWLNFLVRQAPSPHQGGFCQGGPVYVIFTPFFLNIEIQLQRKKYSEEAQLTVT